MRVTLDTNVLIAAFISRGTCHEIFEHIVRNHQLIISEFILHEFSETLMNKFKFTEAEVNEAAELLKAGSEVVEPTRLNYSICSDPDDDTIIATAISGHCECLLSGDKALTDLREFQGVKILRPSEFWQFEVKVHN